MITHGLDIAILDFFQGLESPVLDSVMSAFTRLGDHGILWITLCLVLIAYKPTRLWGGMALAGLAMTFFIDEFLLKSIFLRERPFVANSWVELIIDPPSGYSFPSGHSATAFAVASCIALCPRIRLPLRVLFVACAAIIAFSRVYLSVHYFTDVLCGSLVGMVCGLVFGWAVLRWQRGSLDAAKDAGNLAAGA